MTNSDLKQSVLLPLSKLKTNNGQIEGLPKNPRVLKDEKFNKLKKSIEENPEMLGLRELLVYPMDDGTFVIIGGNMRYRAMLDLKFKEAPCKIIDAGTSVEQLRAYTIKDNNNYGEWDLDMLANEWDLDELNSWGLDLDFSLKQGDEAVEDDYEEPENLEPRTKRGDIWQLGEHRLMCGDSCNADDVKRLMDGELADLFLTDPPYNVNYEGATKDNLKIQNDSMDDEKFRAFLTDAFLSANDVMKGGAAFYIWHADSEGFNFRYAVRAADWQMRETLIWNKNQLVMGRQDYQWKHEPCLYGWKSGAGHAWYGDRKQTTVINFDKPQRNGEHPTMKPVGLFGYLMQNSSKEGDIILDSFGGSGTTIIASEQLNRRARVMELDEHYCDVIVDRWQELTGKEAVKL
jgi:site-specific DNA-methyltransferase (adenine-specific)